jgi:hypothetical protein
VSRIGRRFVPTSTITRRMDAQDARRSAAMRARREAQATKSATLTIACRHCGPVVVPDADTAYVRRIVAALAVGHAPLGAITCPMCLDEVRALDVQEAPPLVTVCSWCSDARQRTADAMLAGRDVTHGICPDCRSTAWERR